MVDLTNPASLQLTEEESKQLEGIMATCPPAWLIEHRCTADDLALAVIANMILQRPEVQERLEEVQRTLTDSLLWG